MRSLLQVAVIVIAAGVAIVGTMPEATWNRLSTTVEEFEGGTMSGRTDIWDRGWVAFLERPILGAGANAFGAATTPGTGTQGSAHNMVLALLVEQGAFGLCVFGGLLVMCAWVIVGLPARDRIIWVPAMLSWFIFAMLHDAHTDRVSWVVFGLLAAEGATRRHSEPAVQESRIPASGAVAEQVAGHPVHLRTARSR
jgi:O-antigen ligase